MKIAHSKGFLVALALIVATVLLTGCDPGVALDPGGWDKKDQTWFAKQVGSYNLQLSNIRSLAGEKYQTITLKAENPEDVELRLSSATLATATGTYAAKGIDGQPWPAAAPKGSAEILMNFEFDQTLQEVYAGDVLLTLNLAHGKGTTMVVVRYVKVALDK